MSQFKHPNVVTTYGMVSERDIVSSNVKYVIIHFGINSFFSDDVSFRNAEKGDLREYLYSMRSDDNESISPKIDCHELLSYSRQVASGMVYLSSKA